MRGKIQRERLARLFRAASNIKRIRLIRALMEKPMTMNRLSEYTALPYKTVERHVKILLSVDLLKQRRDGLEIELSVVDDEDKPYHRAIIDLIGKSF